MSVQRIWDATIPLMTNKESLMLFKQMCNVLSSGGARNALTQRLRSLTEAKAEGQNNAPLIIS